MATRRLPNYLLTYRKHSGLSQSEISFLIGLKNKSELSRYESGVRQPSLRTALACQAAYGTPVSELFGGVSDSAAKNTRTRMRKLQARLQANRGVESTGSGLMQKFQWFSQRLREMPNFKLVSI
jgi:transcriptional regulator with XRE-family HTH domain